MKVFAPLSLIIGVFLLVGSLLHIPKYSVIIFILNPALIYRLLIFFFFQGGGVMYYNNDNINLSVEKCNFVKNYADLVKRILLTEEVSRMNAILSRKLVENPLDFTNRCCTLGCTSMKTNSQTSSFLIFALYGFIRYMSDFFLFLEWWSHVL